MFNYLVRMVIGSDRCVTSTPVSAASASAAAAAAEFKFPGVSVRVVNVLLGGDCCYLDFPCSSDSCFCSTCDSHLVDGACPGCG